MADQSRSVQIQTDPKTSTPSSLPPNQPLNHPIQHRLTIQGSAPTTLDEKRRMLLERKREKVKRAASPSSSDSDRVPSPLKCHIEETKSVPKDLNREAQEMADLDRFIRNLNFDLRGDDDVEEVPLVRKPRGQRAQTEAKEVEPQPLPLAILPPERESRGEPSATPEEVCEASPIVVKLKKDKSTAKIEQAREVKGSRRRKTTAFHSKKVHERMNYSPERTKRGRNQLKPTGPPRSKRSKLRKIRRKPKSELRRRGKRERKG